MLLFLLNAFTSHFKSVKHQSMSKSWVPVGSVHPGRDEVLGKYVDALDSLCENVNSAQFPACSCPVPDTLVLQDDHVRFYFYDWAAQCVRRNAPKVHSSQSIDRLQRPRSRPSGDRVVHPDRDHSYGGSSIIQPLGDRDDDGRSAILNTFINPPSAKSAKREDAVTVPTGGAETHELVDRVVASRLFEVEEGGGRGGWRVATEYFTHEGLTNFVRNYKRTNKGRLTILQRFIDPRPYKGIQDFSQSVFSHYTRQFPTSVHLVRAVVNGVQLGSDASSLSSPGEGAAAHPTLRACVYPPVVLQGRCTSERTVPIADSEIPSHKLENVEGADGVQEICLAMSKYVCHALERRRIAAVPEAYATGKEVRAVSAVVLEFKLSAADGYLYLINVHAVRHTADVGGPDSSFQLSLASVATSSRNVSNVVKNTYAAFHLEFSTNNIVCHEVRSRRRGGAFRDDSSSDSEGSVKASPGESPRRAPTAARCPNCCQSVPRATFVTVRVSDIVQRVRRQGAANRRDRVPVPAAAGVGLWAELPPVLQGLNTTLEELITKPCWMKRTVRVCEECREVLGVEVASDASPRTSSVLADGITSRHSKSLNVRAQPPYAFSESTDAVATTTLQVHLRQVRRIERSKYQLRFPAVCSIPRPYSASSRSESLLAATPTNRPRVAANPYGGHPIHTPRESPIKSSPRVNSRPTTAPHRRGSATAAVPFKHQLDRHSQPIDTSFLRPHPPPSKASKVVKDGGAASSGNVASDIPNPPSTGCAASTSAAIGRVSSTFNELSEEERALVYESFDQ